MTAHRIHTVFGVSLPSSKVHLRAWEEAKWVAPISGMSGHYVISESCPGAPDRDTLDHEIALAMAAPRSAGEEGVVGFGYRTALVLHGLSETFDYGSFFVCRLRPGGSGAALHIDVPFARQWDEPTGTAKKVWAGRQIVVVQRDERMVEAGRLDQVTSGLPVTTPARTLVDCWLRPGYGVGDDRLLAAWQMWLEDAGFGSRSGKVAALRRVLQADSDHRRGRQEAFVEFLGAVDPQVVDEIRVQAPDFMPS